MEDIKNIIQKGLFNAIKDKINEREKLITEMWSYSDQMDNTMDYVYDILSKNIHNGEMYKLDYGIGLRRGIIKNLTLFGIDDITFEYYIYECRDNETCRYIINNAFSENDYSENEKHLVVTFYTVMGQLIEEPSNKNLSHELEHILQISQGIKNNPRYNQLVNSAYNMASSVIADSDNKNKFDVIIAWLIYYSNKHEQDAFMNEYYQDLRNMKSLINDKNSETHLRYNDYLKKVAIFKNNINNQTLLQALSQYKIYGYNIKNFQIMIDKGLHRFQKKMNNIEKHFKNIVKKANEDKIRLGKINNGSLIKLW